MKAPTACALAFAALFAPTRCVATSPVAKVLELLSSLESKVKAQGAEARKAYEESSSWCEDRAKNLDYEIKTGKGEEEDLKASIEQQTAMTSSFATKVEEVSASMVADEADLNSATEVRKQEAGDFAADEKELVEVVSTLQRAIGILERELKKGGAAMMQWKQIGSVTQAFTAMVQASMLSSADAARLTSLVQSDRETTDDDAFGAPAAAAYEGHSGDIIETLENLLDKAKSQLGESRKTEMNSAHNFNMLKQNLEDQIKFASKDASDAKKGVAESGEKKATAEGDLAVTAKNLKEDSTALADLHQDCMTKSLDFEAAEKSRTEELKALSEAQNVISEATGSSFFQVVSEVTAKITSSADLAHFEAVRFVRDLAHKEKSSALAQLASRMAAAMSVGSASADPFEKVKEMIGAMIGKLQDEAAGDASHKAYCDKELAESQAKKTDKDADLGKLTAKIDQMASHSKQLKEETAALQSSLAELASAFAEAQKLRQEEKATVKKSKEETQQGLEGVKMGLKILREFYGKGAIGASEGAATSIIGLLEVVESDFSKSLAEMMATEENAQAAYDEEVKEGKIERVTKDQDVKYKSKEAADLDKAASELTSDRAGTQNEHDAVAEYITKLEQMCVAKPSTYEERKARREAEVAGLKQALTILEGEGVLLQRTRKTRRTLRGAVALHLAA